MENNNNSINFGYTQVNASINVSKINPNNELFKYVKDKLIIIKIINKKSQENTYLFFNVDYMHSKSNWWDIINNKLSGLAKTHIIFKIADLNVTPADYTNDYLKNTLLNSCKIQEYEINCIFYSYINYTDFGERIPQKKGRLIKNSEFTISKDNKNKKNYANWE